ncbi:MAG: addiction module protein [Kiritimatiellae bacterium]|jgi:hypothetical protein|nr:addiction module protein [Kiritimatiellia bacterium]
MNTVLPLDRMSKLEKITVMEELWADLSVPQEDLKMPAWHGDLLKEREQAIKDGTESFIPWDEAKAILERQMCCFVH